MQDVEITTGATDVRPILPSALVSAFGMTAAEADDLADEVGQRLASDPDLCGRPLWRETVVELLVGPGRQNLLLSRWPVEDDPPVVSVIDGGAVDTTLYEVSGANRHALFKRSSWAWSVSRVDPVTGDPASPSGRFHFSVPYTGGYLMPGQVATYSASLPVLAGGSASYGEAPGWVRATDRSVTLRFEVTAPATADVMAGTEPTWPTTVGATVVSGAVTLTARRAFELPPVGSALLKLAASIVAGKKLAPNIKREDVAPGHQIEYFQGDGVGNLAAGLVALR